MKQKFVLMALTLLFSVVVMAERKEVQLRVPQMECANCQAKVEKVLAYEKGVKDLSFDLSKRIVTVTYDDAKTNVASLQDALKKQLQYSSKALGSEDKSAATCEEHKHDDKKAGCSSHSCSSSCKGHNHDDANKTSDKEAKTSCSSSCSGKH